MYLQSGNLHPYRSWLSCSILPGAQIIEKALLSPEYSVPRSLMHHILMPEPAVVQNKSERRLDGSPGLSLHTAK